MKLKLDENLGSRLQQLFQQRGHEVVTVADEQLCSASDETLIRTCQRERRCLVTLDLDFGNPLGLQAIGILRDRRPASASQTFPRRSDGSCRNSARRPGEERNQRQTLARPTRPHPRVPRARAGLGSQSPIVNLQSSIPGPCFFGTRDSGPRPPKGSGPQAGLGFREELRD